MHIILIFNIYKNREKRNMLKKIVKIIRKICTATFIIYGFNLIVSSINIFIPINPINVGVVSFLGFPGLFSLILMFFITK